ncbi:MAG: SAM-dependent chlorinase/fluorinase [Dehalococcoidia bacterium]|nr:SAM-dependent chlorinase/fluorinase [Dehalococcoidia bacterium]
MEKLSRPIFLLTDYGTRDAYVGQLKAVIAGIAPRAPIVDLTHAISPFAVDEGAWVLETVLPVLPEGAIVVAVVDPGVGSSRRALVVAREGRLFVGPDNGLLSPVFGEERRGGAATGAGEVDVRELCEAQLWRPEVSATFHGRDVFAPAAAHFATGASYQHAGPPVSNPVLLPPFCGQPDGFGRLVGEVIHVDAFGNLVTTIRATQLFPRFALEVCARLVDTHLRTFSDAPDGRPFCHVDSSGFLAVAVREGSAAVALGAHRGDRAVLHCR